MRVGFPCAVWQGTAEYWNNIGAAIGKCMPALVEDRIKFNWISFPSCKCKSIPNHQWKVKCRRYI